MIRVHLISKFHCSLCVEAKILLNAIQKEIPFELTEAKLTAQHTDFLQYQYAVPLIFIDGEEVCRYKADKKAIMKKLNQKKNI
jgi:glutaredoxin